MKTCTKCGEEKELTEFHKGKHFCKPCRREHRMGRYHGNAEHRAKTLASARKYQLKNPEKHRANNVRWHKENRGRSLGHKTLAKLRQFMPKWASKEDLLSVYENCPAGMWVDHIIPLRGKNVSGLHVPENLQYLTPEENWAKGNKWEPSSR